MAKFKGFSYKPNFKAIKKLKDSNRKALEATGEKMLADKIRAQEIPFDEGTLQNVQSGIDKVALNKGIIRIYHDTPYAARLYFNPQFDFNKTNNPNAKGEWWEDYISGGNKDKPAKLFAHYLKRFGGDTQQ